MHRSHLRLCAVGLVIALAYLFFSGSSAGGIGLLVAALVCPLAMILAMTVLMGRGTENGPTRPADAADAVEQVDRA